MKISLKYNFDSLELLGRSPLHYNKKHHKCLTCLLISLSSLRDFSVLH